MFVRRATDVDVPELLQLCRRFHEESPVHNRYPFSAARVLALLDAAFTNSDWLAIVVVEEEQIVGMALYYAMPMFFSDCVEVADLTFYVAPERRGSRAAVLMLAEVRKWAALKRADVLKTGVTTGILSDQVERFFERCGFVKIGTLLEDRA